LGERAVVTPPFKGSCAARTPLFGEQDLDLTVRYSVLVSPSSALLPCSTDRKNMMI
jgi:hypothetical protein